MDVLAIGAHADDCELFMGGTLARMTEAGHAVAIADLTRGECASRGTPELRRREAEEAAKILGVEKRIALDLGDTAVGSDPAHRLEVIRLIRAERPALVFTHDADDRHPDHGRTNRLVREACFFAYVEGIDTGQERFRPRALIEFVGNPESPPGDGVFVVPLTEELITRKMKSLRAYKSQFYGPEFEGPATWISSETYFQQIQSRARYWGGFVGENYGEPFRYGGVISVSDPMGLFR